MKVSGVIKAVVAVNFISFSLFGQSNTINAAQGKHSQPPNYTRTSNLFRIDGHNKYATHVNYAAAGVRTAGVASDGKYSVHFIKMRVKRIGAWYIIFQAPAAATNRESKQTNIWLPRA